MRHVFTSCFHDLTHALQVWLRRTRPALARSWARSIREPYGISKLRLYAAMMGGLAYVIKHQGAELLPSKSPHVLLMCSVS